jgi:riboflavin biosynthesis pyrimidine reductase
MRPIERLFERAGLPFFGLPTALASFYGGDFGLACPGLYANFVSSVDGVVALPGADGDSGRVISGASEPDRFVMALLRACADAVLIGAGTFRAARRTLWRAESVYPAAAELFADLRKQLGLRPHPLLVVVTASGHIDPSQAALRDSLVVTTPAGEAHLRRALPDGARIAVLDAAPIGGRPLVDLLAAEKLPVVLTEGGPMLFGRLLQEKLVDELFLTTSPRLFGRSEDDRRKSLVESVALSDQSLELVSVRRHESHLFLRYACGRSDRR